MRVFGSVVTPSTALVATCDPKVAGSSAIRPQIIGDQSIPFRLDQHIEDLAFGIDGAVSGRYGFVSDLGDCLAGPSSPAQPQGSNDIARRRRGHR